MESQFAYADVDDFKVTIGVTGTFQDDDIEREILTASRDIDDITGQRFFTTTEDEERLFYADPCLRYLYVGAVLSVTELKVDTNLDGGFSDTWTSPADYRLTPWNNPLDGRPYRYVDLQVRGQARPYLFWPHCSPNVKITGKFGWDAVPSKIKTATVLLAARYLHRGNTPLAVLGGEESAMAIVRSDPDINSLLKRFMRPPGVG